MKQLFITKEILQATIIRLTLGVVIFPHGAQKALGLFNGFGFTGTMNYFTETMHLPYLIGLLVIVTEFAGAIALIMGFATRIWSVMFVGVFTGIIFTSHLETGFFMDWFGQNPKPANEGYEYHLLVLGMAASLIWSGSGKYSLDRLIFRKKDETAKLNNLEELVSA